MAVDDIDYSTDFPEYEDYAAAIKARFGGDTTSSVNTSPGGGASTDSTVDEQSTLPAASAGTDAGTPPGEGAADAPTTTPNVLNVDFGDGQQVAIDEATARRLLAVASWADSLDRNHAATLRAISDGHAVAVDHDDFLRYQAWQRLETSQRQPQQRDPFADAMLDDVQQRELDRLRLENEQLQAIRQQQQQPDPRLVAMYQQQQQQEMARRTETFQTAVHAWADSRGIDHQAADQLLAEAVRANVIPAISEQERVYAPDGTMIADANIESVAHKAMNFALSNNPDMFTQVMTQQTPPATQSQADAAVARKKALAGSMAVAPSASLPQTRQARGPLTLDEQRAGIAEFLRNQA